MSIRCMLYFESREGTPDSMIYRHIDGYPEGVLPDLDKFFTELEENVQDTRFNDAPYLASKYLVWQSKQNACTYNSEFKRIDAHYLDFLSVAPVIKDYGWIEYKYHIICDTNGRPRIEHEEVEIEHKEVDLDND